MAHIEQLDALSVDPTTQLADHARLAQLANIQGQTERATEEWGKVEVLRKGMQFVSPELEDFLENEKQTLGYQPLLLH